ncbi:MAG: hypothetical protein ABI759_26345 [Candidatus Solibacter sp.]
MKTFLKSILILTAAGTAAFSQQWEFGGTGGLGFLNTVNVGGSSTATAGFQPGAAFGGYIGFNQSAHFGGEIRYNYLQSNLKLKSGGTEATFSGMSHVVHYDLIIKTTRNEGKVQLFAALGGGMKYFQGTGKEAAYQPLSQFGYFTKTSQLKPMASVGGGVKFAITRNVFIRTEVRDYITAFPTELITPAPGTKYGSILHDIVPMVGISVQM